MLYFYSGDEYFLSSIVSSGDLTVEKDVGGFLLFVALYYCKVLAWVKGFGGA